MALSIPKPRNAAIRCSIVETLTPCWLDIVVQSVASTTFSKFGIIILLCFRSVLLNIIPEFGDAGKIFKFTVLPVWIPTPEKEVFQTLYYELQGNLTTNLKGSRRFLQIGVGVSTKYDQAILTNVENHLTAIKADILSALSDYTEEMVEGREARKLLANDLRDVINAKLEDLEGFGGIEEVHLTSYVLQ